MAEEFENLQNRITQKFSESRMEFEKLQECLKLDKKRAEMIASEQEKKFRDLMKNTQNKPNLLLMSRDQVNQSQSIDSTNDVAAQEMDMDKDKITLDAQFAKLQDQIDYSHEKICSAKNRLLTITDRCQSLQENLKIGNSKSKRSLQLQSDHEIEDESKCLTKERLTNMERALKEAEAKHDMEVEKRKQQTKEWHQCQSELLTALRIAENNTAEALSERDRLECDKKSLTQQVNMLQREVKLLKENLNQSCSSPSLQNIEAAQRSSFSTNTAISMDIGQLYANMTSTSIDAKKPLRELQPATQESHDDMKQFDWLMHSKKNSLEEGNQVWPIAPQEQQQMQLQSVRQQQKVDTNTSSDNESFNIKIPKLMPGSVFNVKSPIDMLMNTVSSSKRSTLLLWCQNKTMGYRYVDITNFSSSWNDGLGFCAILHSYMPDRIPYETLTPADKHENFTLAFTVAESIGIPTILNKNVMHGTESPHWSQVLKYINSIYDHFESKIKLSVGDLAIERSLAFMNI